MITTVLTSNFSYVEDPCNIANPDSWDNSTYLACTENIVGGWNATVMHCPGSETYFYERLGECTKMAKINAKIS